VTGSDRNLNQFRLLDLDAYATLLIVCRPVGFFAVLKDDVGLSATRFLKKHASAGDHV
jgi:hypothetical protein